MNRFAGTMRLQAASRSAAGLPLVILAALLCYGIARIAAAAGGSPGLGLAVGLLVGVPALLAAEVGMALRPVAKDPAMRDASTQQQRSSPHAAPWN